MESREAGFEHGVWGSRNENDEQRKSLSTSFVILCDSLATSVICVLMRQSSLEPLSFQPHKSWRDFKDSLSSGSPSPHSQPRGPWGKADWKPAWMPHSFRAIEWLRVASCEILRDPDGPWRWFSHGVLRALVQNAFVCPRTKFSACHLAHRITRLNFSVQCPN